MKIMKLVVAAAIAVSGLTIGVAPAAAAQRGDHDRMEHRDHRDNARDDRRDDARDDRRDDRRDTMRGHRGRYGANSSYNRGRHHGWRNTNSRRHRVCRWTWRHHQRQRVCWYNSRRSR